MVAILKSTIDVESLLDEIELPNNMRRNPRFRPILEFHINSSLRKLQYHASKESVERRIVERVERARDEFLRHRWKSGRPPRFIDSRYFPVYEKRTVPVNEQSRNHALERLKMDTLRLVDGNLQDVVNLRSDDFTTSIRHYLERHDITVFDGLFLVFSGLPFEKGESQLTIDQYGGRPLCRYMFHHPLGAWQNVANRILATRDLCYMMSGKKEVWKITNDDFVLQSNPFRRSLFQLLEAAKNVYGTHSHFVAMTEAGVLTPDNYPVFRENNMSRSPLTLEQVREISAKAKENLNDEKHRNGYVKDFKMAGYAKSQIDRIFGTDFGVLTGMGISIYDPLNNETIAQIRNLPWEIRKTVGFEMYLMGYGRDYIASVIGTSSDPCRKPTRQDIEDMIKPSLLDRHMHDDTKAEKIRRKNQRKLEQLCRDSKVSLRRVKRVVDEYHDVLDVPRISEYFRIPVPVVSLYLHINRKGRLPTEDVDLAELKSLYEMWYDVSPKGMNSDHHTSKLYVRLSARWGSYVNALRGININPTVVYHRRRKEIAA